MGQSLQTQTIYLTFPPALKRQATKLNTLTEQLTSAPMEDDLHVSLSKTFYAKHWHIQPLAKTLADTLRGIALPSALLFDHSSSYSNEHGTRFFVAMDLCASDQGKLIFDLELIKLVDNAIGSFGFEPYYPDPKLHMSLASGIAPILENELSPARLELSGPFAIFLRAGNQSHRLL